ncbi:acetyltransferase [Bacillus sp. FJAT-27225]|uniref:GNAT family N-acetyltransferase n=1 Tax=Bacillus sp. FJAT-27225 TaxID=1743144 RepID=UPI00080C2320|nr:GNAT family N-acetyltransferase [Bacillus sp. FJAT-27225]OCA85814.1 acetyltransferase [Bacillus sp. FJAT-27225]
MAVVAETERLQLRVFQEEDGEAAKLFWGDKEVMEHCNGAIPHEHLTKALESYASCHETKGLSVYAVVEKETGNVIGAAGFNVRSTPEKSELIYHFAKSAWGKGYATEAAAACVKAAERHPDAKIIFASADRRNTGSLKILERIGFEYKGMKWFEDTKQEEPYYEMKV